jgi:4-oxalocrotonate tautomerase
LKKSRVVDEPNESPTAGNVTWIPMNKGEKGGRNMPLIQVKVIEGVFSQAQKKEMIQKITDTMVSIEGENMRQVTFVIVEEIKSGDWGIGGKAMTTNDVKALQAGK